MSDSWKPEDHSTVAPYLIVDDARRLMRFLEAVFDGRAGRSFERPDGSIMHAEVRIGDSIVMLGEATEQWRSFPSMVHVYVADVDAVCQRAVAAGAVMEQEPAQAEGDPDRRAGFRDPSGNSWWASTQVGAS